MPFDSVRFEAATTIERYALARLEPFRGQAFTEHVVGDLRRYPNKTGICDFSVLAGGGYESGVFDALDARTNPWLPIGVLFAFQLLDKMIEAGHPEPDKKLPFAKKLSDVQSGDIEPPSALVAAPELWHRLMGLYAALEPARHALTHNWSSIGLQGELHTFDAKGHETIASPLTATEIGALMMLAQALGTTVLGTSPDSRLINLLSVSANLLARLHGSPEMPTTPPKVLRAKLVDDLVPQPDGLVLFDISRAHAIIAQQRGAMHVWDLELRGVHHVYSAPWSAVPEMLGEAVFAPLNPPKWLAIRSKTELELAEEAAIAAAMSHGP